MEFDKASLADAVCEPRALGRSVVVHRVLEAIEQRAQGQNQVGNDSLRRNRLHDGGDDCRRGSRRCSRSDARANGRTVAFASFLDACLPRGKTLVELGLQSGQQARQALLLLPHRFAVTTQNAVDVLDVLVAQLVAHLFRRTNTEGNHRAQVTDRPSEVVQLMNTIAHQLQEDPELGDTVTRWLVLASNPALHSRRFDPTELGHQDLAVLSGIGGGEVRDALRRITHERRHQAVTSWLEAKELPLARERGRRCPVRRPLLMCLTIRS